MQIGTLVGGDATKVNGVSVPLADQFALIPSEIAAINEASTAFNATVKAVADANPTRLAHADVQKGFNDFITSKFYVYNNVMITPNINPPTGIYSEDGAHPNSRGYAFISRIIIDAINTKFEATIPITDISLYNATALPIP
jgi:lysophospholipase L1-like esterase